MSLTDA